MPDDRVPYFETLDQKNGKANGRLWRIAAPVALAAVAATILLVWGLVHVSRGKNEADAWVTHTLTVLERTALLEGNLANTIAEGRGFLLDPVPERRSRVDAGFAAVRDDVAALTALTEDNARQRDVLARLLPLIDMRIGVLNDVMQRAASSEPSEVVRIFRSVAANPMAASVHQAIIDLRDEEHRLLTERGGIAKGASRDVLVSLIGCGLLAAICMGSLVVVLLCRRQGRARSDVEQLHLSKLQREQDRFRAAVKAVHGILWTNDAQGWMVGEQPAWSALTGQTYAQYQGFGWANAVHPDDSEPTILAWNAAVADRRLFVFEHRVRCLDDGYRTFAIRAAPVLDENGEVREWVGIHTDVTAQRTAELANTTLAAIVTTANDAIVSISEDGAQILSWNGAAERLFGYSEAEAVGSPANLLLPEGSSETETPAKMLAAFKAGQNTVAYETTRVTKSGEAIPVAVTTTRMLAPDGRSLGISGIVHDLRPRLRIETALREANAALEQRVEERTAELVASKAKLSESEAGYRLLAEYGSDMVARLGPDGTWQYVSPAAVQVLGRDPAAMLGCDPVEIVHPDDRAEAELFFDHLRTGRVEAGTMTTRALHLGRGEAWIEIAAGTLYDETSNQPEGCVLGIRDVTDRRRLELERESQANALQVSNDKLEQSNGALDRLARQLARARDQANAASRAKSRFLASMSHELRTPLNGILGYAHLIRAEGQLSPLQASRIGTMLNAGEHLLEMISGVLSLSEVEQQRVELQSTTIGLAKLASDCVDVVRPSAAKKNLVLTVEIAPDAPDAAVVDATKLRQVLLNLLGNAVKFTASGMVTVRLKPALVEACEDDVPDSSSSQRGLVRFEVADTGPGIPKDKRHRLFQDFERLSADPDAIEGAGLGLALSARLTTIMGGSIGFSDNDGGGSVFWIELPLGEPVPTLAPSVVSPVAHPSRRVLLVDDIAMNRDVATAFLQAAGYDVTCVDNGADAVAIAGRESFDVILMDVRMPEMDGLEATRRIRTLPAPHGEIPVIALTAQAFAEQIAECRDAGMDAHLTKPFSPDSLSALVAQVITIGRQPVIPPVSPGEVELGADRSVFVEATFNLTSSCLLPDDTGTHLRAIADRIDTLQAHLAQFDPSASEDGSDLAEIAHALAGGAGLFGFDRLSCLAQGIEYAIVSGAEELGPHCVALSAALTATAPELARCIAASAPAPCVAAT